LNLSDPKFGLYEQIKDVEKQLGDKSLTLNAFVLSATAFNDILNTGTVTRATLEERHVLFLDDGRETYLGKLIDRALA
jgi:hypothetical protein